MATPTSFNFPSLNLPPDFGFPTHAFPREEYLPAGERRPPVPHDRSRRNLRNEMCHSMEEVGGCPYGDKCDFAHRPEELEAPSQEKPSGYRRDLCRNFFVSGVCYYGTRCRFSHDVKYAHQLGWVYDPSISAYVRGCEILYGGAKVAECWASRKPPVSPPSDLSARIGDFKPVGEK